MMAVSNSDAGGLIGRHARNIARLRRRFAGEIHIDRTCLPQSSERRVVVTAPLDLLLEFIFEHLLNNTPTDQRWIPGK